MTRRRHRTVIEHPGFPISHVVPRYDQPVLCQRCGKKLDRATDPTDPGKKPNEGDASICFHCGNLAMFTGVGLELRRPTDEERASLLNNPHVAKFYKAMLYNGKNRTGFPCGCRFASNGPALIFEPCSPTCDVYAYAIEESRKAGHPIDIVTASDA